MKRGILAFCLIALSFSSYSQSIKSSAASQEYCEPLSPGDRGYVQYTGRELTAGSLGGGFSVDGQGNGVYSVPLVLPPGRVGMAPSLSVNYNSSKGYGGLGYGFTLSGGSSITRSSRSMARDGSSTSISLGLEDRYVLDGVRLEALKTGVDGRGRRYLEFRSVPSNYASVVGYFYPGDVAEVGIQEFQVWGKDGRVYYYGWSEDSRILYRHSEGRRSVMSWELTAVFDRDGNGIEYSYDQHLEGGSVLSYQLVGIDYTVLGIVGEGSYEILERGDQKVRLQWEEYNTGASSYLLGNRKTREYRLRQIDTHSEGEKVRGYRMHYSDDGVFAGEDNGTMSDRIRLLGISEESGDGLINHPTRFYWSGVEEGYEYEEEGLRRPGQRTLRPDANFLLPPMVGDFNGDGYDDVLGPFENDQVLAGEENPGVIKLYFRFGSKEGFGPLVDTGRPYGVRNRNDILGLNGSQSMSLVPFDYNGDGYTDFLRLDTVRPHFMVYVTEYNDDGEFVGMEYVDTGIINEISGVAGLGQKNTGQSTHLLDIDGDGDKDLVFARNLDEFLFDIPGFGVALGGITIHYAKNEGAGFGEVVSTRIRHPYNRSFREDNMTYDTEMDYDPLVLDIEGDGSEELLLPMWGWTGYGLGVDAFDAHPEGVGYYVVDFNNYEIGRSLSWDYVGGSSITVRRTNLHIMDYGSGTPVGVPNSEYNLGDFNGDGLYDVLSYYQPSGLVFGLGEVVGRLQNNERRIWLQLNKGDGSFEDREEVRYWDEAAEEWRTDIATGILHRSISNVIVRDMNGDGRSDIVLDGNRNQSLSWHVLYSKEEGLRYRAEELGIDLEEVWDNRRNLDLPNLYPSDIMYLSRLRFGDVNGDGMTDVLFGDRKIFYHEGGYLDVVEKIRNGIGGETIIDWSTLRNVVVDWEPQSYPLRSMRGSKNYVVKGYKKSSGNGGEGEYARVEYRYHNPWVDIRGGGRGYSQRDVYYPDSGLLTEEEYGRSRERYVVKELAIEGGLELYVRPYSGVVTEVRQYLRPEFSDSKTLLSKDMLEWSLVRDSQARVGGDIPLESYRLELQLKDSRVYDARKSLEENIEEGDMIGRSTVGYSYRRPGSGYGELDGKISLIYDAEGRLAEGTQMKYRYEDREGDWLLGLPKEVITEVWKTGEEARLGSRVVYEEYDLKGRLREVSRYAGRGASEELVGGLKMSYDGYGNSVEIVAVNSEGEEVVNRYCYGEDGYFMIGSENMLGHKVQLGYDKGLGVVLGSKDVNGLVTRYSYDGFGRVKQIDMPGLNWVRYSYDWVRDEEGNKVPHSYREIVEDNFGGYVESWYNRAGKRQMSRRKDREGRMLHSEVYYDLLGRVLKQYLPLEVAEVGEIEALVEGEEEDNRVLQLVDGDARGIGYSYDAFSQLHMTRNLEGLDTKYSYGKDYVELEDVLGRVSRVEYDYAGRVKESIDALGTGIKYKYGVGGRLKEIEDGLGSKKRYYYDVRNRLTGQEDPYWGVSSISYDSWGRVKSTTDNLGGGTSLSYDVLGRLTRKKTGEGVYKYSYDGAAGKGLGKLWKIWKEGEEIDEEEYSYTNTLGQIERHSIRKGERSYSYDYSYDVHGRVQEVLYPEYEGDGMARFGVRYKYQEAGEGIGAMVGIQNSSTDAWYYRLGSTNIYGQLEEDYYGDRDLGVAERGYLGRHRYSYDEESLRLTSLGRERMLAGGIVTEIDREGYSYDGVGNLLERCRYEGGRELAKEEYKYDKLDRLVEETLYEVPTAGMVNGEEALEEVMRRGTEYDILGNMISKSDVGRYRYLPVRDNGRLGKRLHNVPGGDGFRRVRSYDGMGRMVRESYYMERNGERIAEDVRKRLEIGYDREGRKVRISKGEDETLYRYGVGSYREVETAKELQKSIGGLYSEVEYREEAGAATTKREQRYRVMFGGREVVTVKRGQNRAPVFVGMGQVGNIVWMPEVGGEKGEYMLVDRQGSVSVVLDKEGNIIGRYSYDAWGKRRSGDWLEGAEGLEEIEKSRPGYTGYHGIDTEKTGGLVDMGARLYDSDLGVFTSADPVTQSPGNSQNYSPYSYVFNNPLKYTDPTGMQADAGVGASIDLDSGDSYDWGDNSDSNDSEAGEDSDDRNDTGGGWSDTRDDVDSGRDGSTHSAPQDNEMDPLLVDFYDRATDIYFGSYTTMLPIDPDQAVDHPRLFHTAQLADAFFMAYAAHGNVSYPDYSGQHYPKRALDALTKMYSRPNQSYQLKPVGSWSEVEMEFKPDGSPNHAVMGANKMTPDAYEIYISSPVFREISSGNALETGYHGFASLMHEMAGHILYESDWHKPVLNDPYYLAMKGRSYLMEEAFVRVEHDYGLYLSMSANHPGILAQIRSVGETLGAQERAFLAEKAAQFGMEMPYPVYLEGAARVYFKNVMLDRSNPLAAKYLQYLQSILGIDVTRRY